MRHHPSSCLGGVSAAVHRSYNKCCIAASVPCRRRPEKIRGLCADRRASLVRPASGEGGNHESTYRSEKLLSVWAVACIDRLRYGGSASAADFVVMCPSGGAQFFRLMEAAMTHHSFASALVVSTALLFSGTAAAADPISFTTFDVPGATDNSNFQAYVVSGINDDGVVVGTYGGRCPISWTPHRYGKNSRRIAKPTGR